MNPINQLHFAVSDRINDNEVNPSYVPLTLLGEFQEDVSNFLRGSNRDVDLANVIVSIEQGSLAFLAVGLLTASALWNDLERLHTSNSLASIDPKRAKVIERWQNLARKNEYRRYFVTNQSAQFSFSVDANSNFHSAENIWVYVEKYLHGKVIDIGGKITANVHLELEEGTTLTIQATQEQLAQGEQNRLYRPALLHVMAEENLLTGQLRNHRLLDFVDYHPSYNETTFNQMVVRGTQAWADVTDATAWLQTLRGYQA
jgi:hypothetical protein